MYRIGCHLGFVFFSAVLTAFVSAAGVAAQPAASTVVWPKQMTLLVPFPPGASNDTFARALAQKLAPRLGVTMIVDNKPGAGGSIGAGVVANSAPNGTMLMLTSSTFATNSAVQRKLPYDPVKSFTPIALVAKGPLVIAVGANTPYQKLTDLLDAAKADKTKLSYGSAGFGSINHMGIEIMNSLAKVEMTHIPYKGISFAITDVIGGHIQFTLATLPSVASQAKGGHVRALAVSSKGRSSFMPEIPPVSDTLPGYDVEIWWGILAPAGMPADMAEALNAEIRKVIDEPDMRARFAQEGAEPSITMNAAEFAVHVKTDIEKWRNIAKERNILAD